MEYKKDLLAIPGKSNKFQIVVGIIFIVLAIVTLVAMYFAFEVWKQFSWIDSLLIGLLGIVQLLGGMGLTIGKFFGKTFIDIDSDRMKFKLGIFEKEKKFNWKDITAIDYKPNAFKITQGDNKTQVIKIFKT